MAWTLHLVAASKKSEVETALHDDIVSRQSQKLRDASALGGASGQLYVLVEGSAEAVGRAEGLLKPLSEPLTPADRDAIYRRLKDEEESASAGMGLFFTE